MGLAYSGPGPDLSSRSPAPGRTEAVNVAHALERAARHFPDKPAILFEEGRLDFRELNAAASRTAHGLAAWGVQPGDRVALCLPNIPAFAIAYAAIHKLGAVPVSVNVM